MDKNTILIATLTALAACSNAATSDSVPIDTASSSPTNSGSVSSKSTQSALDGSNTVLLRLPDSAEGDGAALQGVLAQQDGCLGIKAGDGFYSLASTNPKVRWNDSSLSLSDGSSAKLGDNLLLGGSEATSPGALEFVDNAPAVCVSKKIWVTTSVVAR